MESFLWLIVVIILYFAPTWCAAKGRRGSVFVVNLFFGITGIGWAIAMYMAIRSQEAARAVKGGA